MSFNFPHREPVVVRDHELRVTRRFPSEGDIKVRGGERVAADQSLGRSDTRLLAFRLAVAEQLAVPPREVAKYLLKPVGSAFAVGEPMARVRRGLRSAVVTAPVACTLIEIDGEVGSVVLAPAGGGDVPALVPGDVEYVDGQQAVVIRTVGSRVLGAVGLGGQTRGPLKVAVDGPEQELTANRVTADLSGAIVVGGSFAGVAALAKLADIGAVGLVTGGLVERDVAAFLGGQAEDRLAAWRPAPASRIIGEGQTARLALMATEGFGPLAMNAAAFALLADLAGRQAVLLTATRVAAPLIRPELIVPNEDALDEDAPTSQAALVPGASVRLVAQSDLGLVGTVSQEPRRERLGDGQTVDVVEVALTKGGTRLVPVVDVEIVA